MILRQGRVALDRHCFCLDKRHITGTGITTTGASSISTRGKTLASPISGACSICHSGPLQQSLLSSTAMSTMRPALLEALEALVWEGIRKPHRARHRGVLGSGLHARLLAWTLAEAQLQCQRQHSAVPAPQQVLPRESARMIHHIYFASRVLVDGGSYDELADAMMMDIRS